ncbi:MarR family winged helix-turn-helix transcriptional regulator [Novosphingobium sp. BL-8A]|uniref:MarR family winged helix-turn-helix transcriptional regulator n=1 Tax=Novosphingobium sp. BL-8A TaxID=3127639 RepID=UPI00375809BB
MTDYVAQRQGAALGARLRRLSATIDADAAKVYAAAGIAFEQRWFGLINQLAHNGPMSVSDLAQALGVTHPSISEARQSLEKKGLVTATPDPTDARRRVLSLSPTGVDFAAKLRPMWDAFDDVAEQLDTEAGEVTKALLRLEQALARKSLQARLADRLRETAGMGHDKVAPPHSVGRRGPGE